MAITNTHTSLKNILTRIDETERQREIQRHMFLYLWSSHWWPVKLGHDPLQHFSIGVYTSMYWAPTSSIPSAVLSDLKYRGDLSLISILEIILQRSNYIRLIRLTVGIPTRYIRKDWAYQMDFSESEWPLNNWIIFVLFLRFFLW